MKNGLTSVPITIVQNKSDNNSDKRQTVPVLNFSELPRNNTEIKLFRNIFNSESDKSHRPVKTILIGVFDLEVDDNYEDSVE